MSEGVDSDCFQHLEGQFLLSNKALKPSNSNMLIPTPFNPSPTTASWFYNMGGRVYTTILI